MAYTKQDADERTLMAALIAWGTNMGLGRMGQTSDVDYQALATTSDNFIRRETLRAANDLVSNATAKLPMFHLYDVADRVHSSSDGQKFETQLSTVNARHSPKYFGLKKGVVSYSLVANHILVNAKVIGADEHESHYVFDLLFNNTTNVQPEVHSTDTHGTNEVNFALLSLAMSFHLATAISTVVSARRFTDSSILVNMTQTTYSSRSVKSIRH